MKKCETMPVSLVSRTLTILKQQDGLHQSHFTICRLGLHFVDVPLVDSLFDVSQPADVQRRMRQSCVHPRQSKDRQESRHKSHDEKIPMVSWTFLQPVQTHHTVSLKLARQCTGGIQYLLQGLLTMADVMF